MKRTVCCIPLFLMVFFACPPSGSASETIDTLPPLVTEENPALNPFSLTVTGDGRLITKPGPLFTEGGDYSAMELPYLLSTPSAISYPRWAVRQGWEGKFVLAIEVLKDGTVGRTQVMESTRHRLLDHVAEKAVRGWKFHPAMENGQSIVTCIQIPITFQIEKE